MQVIGIGNVTACNKSYIFLHNEGEQERIRATPELLSAIRDTAHKDYEFYDRMWEEINTAYEKRKVEVEKKYHFITDEMVKEAFARSRKEGFSLSLIKDSNNEECVRQYGRLHGLFEGANLALDKKHEAQMLLVQAQRSLSGK